MKVFFIYKNTVLKRWLVRLLLKNWPSLCILGLFILPSTLITPSFRKSKCWWDLKVELDIRRKGKENGSPVFQIMKSGRQKLKHHNLCESSGSESEQEISASRRKMELRDYNSDEHLCYRYKSRRRIQTCWFKKLFFVYL